MNSKAAWWKRLLLKALYKKIELNSNWYYQVTATYSDVGKQLLLFLLF